MDQFELAWAAGFFDGEGWSGAPRQQDRRTTQAHARVNQASADGMPAALIRFQSALGGLGRLAGPFKKEGRIDLYHWHVSSRPDVSRLLELLSPWLGQVKLDQLCASLSATSRIKSQTAEDSDLWRAWAAGLYDGEGSTYLLDHRTHVGHRIAQARITQASLSGIPEVLRRFHSVVRVGFIYGPYEQRGSNLPVYRWNSGAFADIRVMLETIWPRLGPVKRQQAGSVLDVIGSQETLPRGRPDWGNRKTHCVNGHEYAKARIRPFRARNGGSPPRDSEQCLQCAREQAKARREQRRRSATDDGGRSVSEASVVYLLK